MPDIRLKPLPPAEAIAFFQQKGYRVGFDYRDVWRQEHQAAFTVAKAMHVDLLADIREEVGNALQNGTTFQDFQKALAPKLQARGWWGRREMLDPATGDTKMVQLGSPRRLGVIFDTNLATAYSEGQWERIQRGKALFPYLEYVRSASSHPRPSHLAYAGLVLPADDPFWQAHMPVKEWGCKCTVIQHSQHTLDREGLKVGQAPPESVRTYTNPRTGETTEVPEGVDPAFNYPPGGRRANLGRMMMDKANALSAATAARVMADGAEVWQPLVKSEFQEFVGRYARGERRGIGTQRTVGAFSPEVVDALVKNARALQHGTISVDLAQLPQLVGNEGAAFVAELPDLLQRPGEIWLAGDRLVMLSTAPDDLARVARIVIQLNAPGTGASVGNSVIAMDLIEPAAFKRRGLVRLDDGEGALP